MVLNKKAKTEKTLFDLDILLKSLKKEVIRLSGKNLLNTIQDNILVELSRGRN